MFSAVASLHRDSASDLGITRFHTLATPNTAKNQGKTALCSIETELFDGLYGHLRNPCFRLRSAHLLGDFSPHNDQLVFRRPLIRQRIAAVLLAGGLDSWLGCWSSTC